MKKYIFTTICGLLIYGLAAGQSIKKEDLAHITRWTGSFTFTVDKTDFFPQAFMRHEFHWSFSGEISMEKDEDFEYSWHGEPQDFHGVINDKEVFDSLKYTEDITVRNLKDNYNYAHLSINPDNMTYSLNISAGDFLMKYNVTIPPEIEALKNDTIMCFLYALVQSNKIEKEALNDSFSFSTGLDEKPFSLSNPVIKYSGIAETNHSLYNASPLEGTLVVTLSPVTNEPDITVTVNKITNPHCLCNDSIVEFSARTNAGGGSFEKFEIEYLSEKHPETLRNEGGARPVLVLKATGETSGKIKVKAVYKKDGTLFRSKAYEMNFCKVEKPQAGYTVSNSHGYDKNKYVFSEDNPGSVHIRLFSHIFMNGEKIEDSESTNWYMEPEESYLNSEIAGYGIGVSYKADKMPSENKNFGKKNVKVEYMGYECNCTSENEEIQIFYPRDAKNNPGSENRPNWAYYWNKTKARTLNNFEVVEEIPDDKTNIALPGLACLGQILESSNAGVLARYDPFKGKIYIPENLPSRTCPSRPDGTVYEGIDCFAQVIRHEGRHKEQLTSWWGPNMANYNCIDDVDGDMLPNAIEITTEGCNSLLPWSCPGRPTWLGTVFDVDIDAYDYGWKWNPGDADKEDWSMPGKQF